MTFSMEYTGTHDDVTYTLLVTRELDLSIRVTGTTATGAQVAEGHLRLPPAGAGEMANLLHQALSAIATLEGKAARKRPTPWTPDQDADLRAAWCTYSDRVPASVAIRELAGPRGRSPAAIRARLPRVGCDPDVAGRRLGHEAAALLGRDARPAP